MSSKNAEVKGIRKAAILLLALKPECSAQLVKQLHGRAVEEVMREVASIGPIGQNQRDAVLREFHTMAMASRWADEGGLNYAKMLLQGSLDPKEADRILAQISTQVRRTPFAFMQKAESQNLLTFIQDEHPQTIALIVSHLSHHKAAEILSGLPAAKQIEVIKRVANMQRTNPDIVSEVERGLEGRLANLLTQSFEELGGVETVAEMLNLADRTTEKSIMEGLENEDPDLVEEIRKLMFVFEDVLLVDDKGIQKILKEIDNDQLTIALKTASDELKEKIFSNMSRRAATMIQEDMQYMGPVRVSDVENAQQQIVDVVRRLEDNGEIIVSGRGGDRELVV